MQVGVVDRVVQDVIELDLVDLGDGADVAGESLLHFGLRFSAQHVEVPRLDWLAALADIKLHVRSEPPLVHAEDGDAADVRIDLDLEDMPERVLAGIGNRSQLRRLATIRGRAHVYRRISLGRIRQQLDDDLEQLGDSRAALR